MRASSVKDDDEKFVVEEDKFFLLNSLYSSTCSEYNSCRVTVNYQ